MRTAIAVIFGASYLLLASGCATKAVWSPYNKARRMPDYQRIDRGSLDADSILHIAVSCADGATRTFRCDVTLAEEDGVYATQMVPALDSLPPSAVDIHILTGTEGFETRAYPRNRNARPKDGLPINYPETVGLLGPDWVRVWMTEEDGRPLQLVWLPRQQAVPPWLTATTWTLTAPAALFDVVTFPIQYLYVILFVGWK